MIHFNGKSYPTRNIQVELLGEKRDLIVATIELEDALFEAMDLEDEQSDQSLSVQAMNIDNEIYFYMTEEEFYAEDITKLDEPVKLLSSEFSIPKQKPNS